MRRRVERLLLILQHPRRTYDCYGCRRCCCYASPSAARACAIWIERPIPSNPASCFVLPLRRSRPLRRLRRLRRVHLRSPPVVRVVGCSSRGIAWPSGAA